MKSGIFRVVFTSYFAGEEASDTARENVTVTKHGFDIKSVRSLFLGPLSRQREVVLVEAGGLRLGTVGLRV